MRIGYLIPQFPEQTHAFFWREVESLRAKGHYIRLISTRRPNTPCPHTFAKSAAAETLYLTPPRLGAVAGAAARGISVARHLWSLKETPPARRLIGTLWASAAAQLVAACRADRLDHLHVHSCGNAAHVAALAHRWGGPPYSLSLHGDLPVYGRDHKQKMRNAAFVAVVTRALQRQTHEDIGLPLNRLPVVPMGVDLGRFTPSPTPTRPARPFTFVTVARLQGCKGHRFALDALAQVPNATYRVVGHGPERANLEAHARATGVADRVVFTGPLDQDQVRQELLGADAFLLSSVGLGEAAPVSVMEAMACGKPVIVSVIGGTPDMIDSGVEGYLVDQHDTTGLATAMRSLIHDPDAASRMGLAARSRAENQFDHHANAAHLLACIRKAHSRRSEIWRDSGPIPGRPGAKLVGG